MSLWQLAAKSVWQSRGRYLSYLGSAAFAVMIYFLYTAMALHPGLASAYGGGPGIALAKGMTAAAVVIAIFTFLFLLYANAAFLQSRMKELGLLSLMGVSRKQMVQMLLCENLIVAVVALALGLGLGVLFLKLFFMAVSVLLHLPEQIPVYAGLPVWGRTLAVFGTLFFVVAGASLRPILRRSTIELIRAARQPKAAPTFSRWKAALGLLLMVGGYLWACSPNQVHIVLGVIPVTTMVSVGTYFVMRESSIAILQWLHRRKGYFYRPGPFLNISQLIFKMQDNYRVLSDVTILVAVILAAIGTVVSVFVVFTADAVSSTPHAVQLRQYGEADLRPAAAQVESVLERHAAAGLTPYFLETGNVGVEGAKLTATLMPYSMYSALRGPAKVLPLTRPDEAILVYPSTSWGAVEPSTDRVVVGDEEFDLRLLPDHGGRVLNSDIGTLVTLVVPDERFAAWVEQIPPAERLSTAFWTGPDGWKGEAFGAALTDLQSLFSEANETGPFLSSTRESYDYAVTSLGIALFIGIFVSLVFFAACCSLIYFRLFTEIEDDRKYYRRLQQLGATDGELRRLARQQAMVVFFVPFLLGLVHSTFAMKALGTLLQQTVLQYGWIVAAAYLVLYILYFLGSYGAYWRSIRAGLQRTAPEAV